VAIPLVFAGQVWTIAVARSRMARTARRRRIRDTGEMLRLVFGTLDPAAVATIMVVFVGGWLTAMSGFAAVPRGGPAEPSADCRYRLQNHTVYTCVSKAEYDRAGAGEQRIIAGILLGFLTVHTGVALSVLAGRSKTGKVNPLSR
jgi:hypothetical protein